MLESMKKLKPYGEEIEEQMKNLAWFKREEKHLYKLKERMSNSGQGR